MSDEVYEEAKKLFTGKELVNPDLGAKKAHGKYLDYESSESDSDAAQ